MPPRARRLRSRRHLMYSRKNIEAGDVVKLLLGTLCFLLSIAAADRARAEKRVALVVGNSAYQHTGRLSNPRNDATDVAAALKKHGFDVVEGFDLDKAAFDRKVRDFATQLQNAAVGAFFYAGHGIQVAGQNYLVPTDAELTTAAALDFEMVRLDVVHRVMERQASTNLLFLDACRDNPLARNLARAMGTRSADIGRGLAAVESGVGTLISFSTQPGNVALDGSGRNSPFAGALVKQLSTTKDDLSAVLIAVRNDVMKETQRKQVPWEHSALTGRFFFSPPSPVAVAPPLTNSGEAAQAWALVKDTANPTILEAYAKQFDNTFYAEMARDRVMQMRKAEEARKTEEARKAEEARKTEEARKAEEARRVTDARRAEEARKIEEAGAQEALRIEETRKAEEARKAAAATKLASLPVETAQPPVSGTPAVDKTALARALQKELARVGCDPGTVDGKWGGKAKEALNNFAQRTKSTVPKDDPSEEALSAVTVQRGRICPLQCGANQSEVNGQCVTKDRPQPKQQDVARPQAPPGDKAGAKSSAKEPMCWTNNGYYVVTCSHPNASGQRAY
jgi:uncharacterized caspase-like protein